MTRRSNHANSSRPLKSANPLTSRRISPGGRVAGFPLDTLPLLNTKANIPVALLLPSRLVVPVERDQ